MSEVCDTRHVTYCPCTSANSLSSLNTVGFVLPWRSLHVKITGRGDDGATALSVASTMRPVTLGGFQGVDGSRTELEIEPVFSN